MAGHSLDVLCAGEAMIDFLPEEAGSPVREVERWRRCPGGAVANVAVGLARLGARTAMVGMLSTDEFGTFLAEQLGREGVNVSRMARTDQGKTGLSFVSLQQSGQREFAFFRTRAADLFITEAEIDAATVAAARAVMFGTNALLFRDAQRAALKLVKTGREAGVIVACDPNVRADLWPSPSDVKDLLAMLLPSCHVVKLAEDELALVTGQSQVEPALQALRKMGVELPVVTLAEKGAAFLWQDRLVRVGAPAVRSLDPTGAGDGFMAGLLFGLTRLYADAGGLRFAGVGELREVVQFACVVGARVTESLGAMNGLPRLDEIQGQLPRILRGPPTE